jgi:cytidine deaminase
MCRSQWDRQGDMDGEKGFVTIVAHPYSDDEERALKVVSPCGMCRELSRIMQKSALSS